MNTRIKILEKDVNKKGDLFGRLMKDFFHSLGYNEPQLNINRTGREIDIKSSHRIENKIAIAECKAHTELIGGADINKFVGAFNAETSKGLKNKKTEMSSFVGYFISLSGFKESAKEQENDLDNSRVLLIGPDKIVEELIKGRIIISTHLAIATLSNINKKLVLIKRADLIAYDKGWIWAFFYSETEGQSETHVTFVHAEGKRLIKSISEEIVKFDSENNNFFKGLNLVADEETVSSKNEVEETAVKYFKYLENELGEIQFEGMPTDKEAGSVKVQLENIFVPLHLVKKDGESTNSIVKSESIGEILNKNNRLAILAKPGAGKSTLIKRLAISYAFPERRKKIDDDLPDKKLFPIFLRCRELGEKVTLSVTEIINTIPHRAEISSCAKSFSILVSEALQNGEALILIDGLDEIADDKHRITFVNQLRTFIATFPNINIIVTSREAGFRVVAGSLASYCEKYVLSSLNEDEIHELCRKWHKAIIGDSENSEKEAAKLSDLILRDSRIKVLAENPLLLTTLMFVKRWAGYLPTKRSVLYQEMIKLLLVTWNVEGHEILDIEEAEPQLAFVAYWMTINGKQTITADELNKCLIDARKEMPEILGYTKVSPVEFIKRVESRSSLLILTGHKVMGSGNLVGVYEFLHLSFQEYLTAKAVVKKFLPSSDISRNVVDIVKPNLDSENWKEVIPLIAVLLERDSRPLFELLLYRSKENINISHRGQISKMSHWLLGCCLANEIQVAPNLLEDGIDQYISSDDSSHNQIILNNKYGQIFRDRAFKCLALEYNDQTIFSVGAVVSEIMELEMDITGEDFIKDKIWYMLQRKDIDQVLHAIIGLMDYAFYNSSMDSRRQRKIVVNENVFPFLLNLLQNSNDQRHHFLISWAVAWSSNAKMFPKSLTKQFTLAFIKLWVKADQPNMNHVLSWAIEVIMPIDIEVMELKQINGLKEKISIILKGQSPHKQVGELTSAYLGLVLGNRKFRKECEQIVSKTKGDSLHIKSRSMKDKILDQFIEKFDIIVDVQFPPEDLPF